MPELPEVEVTRRGIEPALLHATVTGVTLSETARTRGLRWPITPGLSDALVGARFTQIGRRGKYLLLTCDRGTLIVHLGMTGTLRLYAGAGPLKLTHDHLDLLFRDAAGAPALLRFNDPRRFGAVLWQSAAQGPIEHHALLQDLGLEPFSEGFTSAHLFAHSRTRSVAVKQFLLAGHCVVGVGNIYCSEALFHAHIRPTRRAGTLTRAECARLVPAIQSTLQAALDKGGSTLRDFKRSDGTSGYFQLDYMAYDRRGLPCKVCATPIKHIVQGQRSTYYCPRCQR